MNCKIFIVIKGLAPIVCENHSFQATAAVNFTFFPNPAVDKVYISYSQDIIGIEILDLLGKKVLQQVGEGKNATVNIAPLSAGFYFLRVSSKTGTSMKQFLISR